MVFLTNANTDKKWFVAPDITAVSYAQRQYRMPIAYSEPAIQKHIKRGAGGSCDPPAPVFLLALIGAIEEGDDLGPGAAAARRSFLW